MTDPAYASAVTETFERRPLRTVLMIDDEFPTFADIAIGGTAVTAKRFLQQDRAVALYKAFQKNEMLCDIENSVDEIQTNKIRKSDLIILDYHLGPGEGNTDKSILILRELAASKHFNTIAVYTAETNLNEVWLDIIASLAGGWSNLPAELSGEAQTEWERLNDTSKLPSITLEAALEFAQKGVSRDLTGPNREALEADLSAVEVSRPNSSKLIDALLHVEMARRAKTYATEPKRRTIGGFKDGKWWIQSGNAFITILNKKPLTTSETDPAGIMASLNDALISWRPNFIQILISEIQNILELEALITEDSHLKQPVTHAALSYYLLRLLGPIDPAASPDVRIPITNLIDKLVEGVRRRLATDPHLLELASNALLGELRDLGWDITSWPKGKDLVLASTDFSRTTGLVNGPDIFSRLNSFLSTEAFQRTHITTGTVIYHRERDAYFIIASPACDLVPRPPSTDQEWSKSIHPVTPALAILLKKANLGSAINVAEQGRHVFIEHQEEYLAFLTVTSSGQPSYEMIMVQNSGLVRDDSGKIVVDISCIAPKMVPGTPPAVSATEREWSDGVFEVIGQLRGVNASRILQVAGQHLSRIGMDYVNMPS